MKQIQIPSRHKAPGNVYDSDFQSKIYTFLAINFKRDGTVPYLDQQTVFQSTLGPPGNNEE